jgi:AcrR family transcriptional regulator
MIEAASAIALTDGLDKVTARRVAAALSVFPGLVDHYFTADQLVAAAFAHAASRERDELFAQAESAGDPLIQIKRLLAGWMLPEHDDVGLMWLDAWQACRHRPALKAEVAAQMDEDVSRLGHLIRLAIDGGQLRDLAAETAAVQIMSLMDALLAQSVMRDVFDYSDIRALVLTVAEQILGVALSE